MVSVTAGLSDRLLLLVFGARAAELGGRSLELLSLGFGAFAIFGVLTTVLNSLKKERSSALVTAGAAAVVALLCWLRVRGSEFGEGLLFRTAIATSVGLLLATAGAGVLVYRAAGAIVAPLSAVRVIAAIAIAVTIGRFLPEGSKVFTVACMLIVGLCYLVLLVLSRELGRADLALFQRVLARGKAR
jgi:stage V sporulation protein B